MVMIKISGTEQVLPWILRSPETTEVLAQGVVSVDRPARRPTGLAEGTYLLELREGRRRVRRRLTLTDRGEPLVVDWSTGPARQPARLADSGELELPDGLKLNTGELIQAHIDRGENALLTQGTDRKWTRWDISAGTRSHETNPSMEDKDWSRLALWKPTLQERVHVRRWRWVDSSWVIQAGTGTGFLEAAGPKLSPRCCAVPDRNASVWLDEDGQLQVRSGNGKVENLLDLHRMGAQEAAQSLAVDLFAEKFSDPVPAVAGALHLLRAGVLEPRDHWWENLGGFRRLPDAAVVVATRALRLGRAAGAKPLFAKAVAAGVPLLKECTRLLWEGLHLFPDLDEQSQHRDRLAAFMDASVGDGPWTCVLGPPQAPGSTAPADLSASSWKAVDPSNGAGSSRIQLQN